MKLHELSVCFHTDKIEECKEFYVKYFNAEINFDCGWYVNIVFDKEKGFWIQLMKPQGDEELFKGGATINLGVKDVDAEYERLIVKEGLSCASPLKDYDWGCRSFEIKDPIGNILYIFSDCEPKGEYAAMIQQD